LFYIQKIKILISPKFIKKTRINPDYSQIFSFVKNRKSKNIALRYLLRKKYRFALFTL